VQTITNAGRVVAGHALNITDANVSVFDRGRYCLDLSGIGITTANAVAIATPDYFDVETASGDIVHVNTGTAFNPCLAGQILVRAYDEAGSLSPAGFDIAFM